MIWEPDLLKMYRLTILFADSHKYEQSGSPADSHKYEQSGSPVGSRQFPMKINAWLYCL